MQRLLRLKLLKPRLRRRGRMGGRGEIEARQQDESGVRAAPHRSYGG
jgi:hypothetical protein